MKFMLMMNHPGQGALQLLSWAREDLMNHINYMKKFATKLGKQGELVAAEGLAFPNEAKVVKANPDGTPNTDGVFPETKEFLVGYWIVEVETVKRAYEIAAEASMAPGQKGEPLHLNIEVRQVMSAPPVE
jgi:hypothetical protein